MGNLFKQFAGWYSERRHNELLVILIQVALDDEIVATQLHSLLNLGVPERLMLIDRWIEELEMDAAPVELITALALLRSNDIADRARSLLKVNYSI